MRIGSFPEDVGRCDEIGPQAGEGWVASTQFADDEADPRGRPAIRFRRSLDADPASTQLPGDVGSAVFVGEQLLRREDQGRAFADVVTKAGQRRRVGARANRRVGEREQRADAGGSSCRKAVRRFDAERYAGGALEAGRSRG